MRLVLNPDLRMQPDGHRAVVHVRGEVESGLNPFVSFLHPRQAVLLALFDGKRSLEAVLAAWANVSGLAGPDEARQELLRLTQSWGQVPLLVPVAGVPAEQVIVYNPADFAVPAREADLGSPRCSRPLDFLHVVTYRCVVDCAYCYSNPPGAPPDLLPLERLDQLLAEASRLGIRCAGLSGGDPLCHPRAVDLIGLYLRHGITPRVSTKVPLSLGLARQLRQVGLQRIQVSIDGLDPQHHDGQVGRVGHHARLMASLDHIRDAGLRLSTNTVVTPLNFPGAVELIPYLAERYENLVRIEMSPYGRSLYRHDDRLFLSSRQYAELQERVASYQQRYPHLLIHTGAMTDPCQPPHLKPGSYDDRAACSGGRWSFTILPNGQVTLCEELYHHPRFLMGDLRRQSIMAMWHSPETLALVQAEQGEIGSDSPCAACRDFAACHHGKGRCYKRALGAYGNDHWDWPDPLCPWAPPGRRL